MNTSIGFKADHDTDLRQVSYSEALAYAIGITGAVDQMLLGLAFSPAQIEALTDWTIPRLPLSGGDLISMGLEQGPNVARLLQMLEKQWVAAGFPDRAQTEAMARQLIAAELRSSQ